MEVADKTISQLAEELAQIPFFEELRPEQLLQRVPFFDDLDEDLIARVSLEAVLRQFHGGQVICRQGDYEEIFYIILAGEVEVSTSSQSQPKIFLGTLSKNEFFGEMGPLSGQPRTANVTALERTIVLEVPKNVFMEMLKSSPSLKQNIDSKYIQRSLRTHLRQVEIFSNLSESEISDLASRIKLLSFKKDDLIIRQGEIADSMYLVRSGFVKVSLGDLDAGEDKTLTYLREGSYFGETALVKEETRNANIVAMTPVEAVQILKADFDKILETNPYIVEQFEKAIMERKHKTDQIQHDERLAEAMDFVVQKGLAQAREVLVIDMSKCLNCDLCVGACESTRGHSRLIRRGSRLGQFLVATSCFHCENPECLLCPFGGIVRDKNGEIHYTESCTGCGGCAKRCPYGNILIIKPEDEKQKPIKLRERLLLRGNRKTAEQRQRVVKCDMCAGLPQMACVYNCPTGAAKLIKPQDLIAKYDKQRD